MKILIAAGIYPPDAGGPAVHAKAQLEGFRGLGFETGLVALAHFRKWPRGIRHLIYFFKLLKQVGKYDIVYAHDALGAGIPAFIASRLSRKKFVIRVGGDITWEYRKEIKPLSMIEWYESNAHRYSKTFLLSRWLLKHADMVIVPSKLLSNLYIKYYGIAEPKIKSIYNPVSGGIGIITKQEKTIIFASRLVRYKNLSLVIKVLSKIFTKNPDLKFIIMGDGPDKANLEKLAQSLGVEKNVIFTGAISQREVFEIISSCLFAIAPALTEFNPNYIMQSIGFGKPFLISRENGLPFEVPKEFMFNPRDESELLKCFHNFLDKQGYSEALSLVRSIDFKMTWDDNLRANVEIIKSLLNGSK